MNQKVRGNKQIHDPHALQSIHHWQNSPSKIRTRLHPFYERQAWLAYVLVTLAGIYPAPAQSFRISSATLSNGVLVMTFPGRADSYYLLHSTAALGVTPQPLSASLGTNGTQSFRVQPQGAATLFFRIQQLPLNASNDQDHDGIPDVWELQYGINPLNAADADQTVPGDTRTWRQLYNDQIPAFASFISATATSLVTATLAPVQVNFTKALTNNGPLKIQLGGTALFGTDYSISGATLISTNPLILSTPVPSSTTTTIIGVQPINTPALNADRSITLSLVSATNGPYQLSTNAPVTHVEVLTESSFPSAGLLAGTLAPTNAVLLGPQPLRMAIRSAGGSQFVAYFDTTRAPFFGAPFTLQALQTPTGFQFQGQATGTFSASGTPPGTLARWTFTLPQTSTGTNGVLISQFRLELVGLTASGRTNTALGTVTFAPLN